MRWCQVVPELARPLLVCMRSGKCFPLFEALWTALETHGVSQHLVWILQLLYDNQRGQVLTDSGESRSPWSETRMRAEPWVVLFGVGMGPQ